MDGMVSLEEAPPVETPVAEPSPPPVEPPVAAAPVVDEDEPQPTDAQSMVPIAALREARSHTKTVKAQAAQLQTENQSLRQRAAQADEMASVIKQWEPTIRAIQQRPDLIAQASSAPKVDPVIAGIADQDAAEYARDIQLYDGEGKLDLVTAKRALARQIRVAQSAAEQAVNRVVKPMQAESAATKSQNLMQTASQVRDRAGRTVNPETLKQFFSVIPPEIAQDPKVASVLYFAAKGWEAHNGAEGPAPVIAPGPVLQTESPGGRVASPRTLTDLDLRMAHDMGRKPNEYQAISARFKPGAMNVLEDV